MFDPHPTPESELALKKSFEKHQKEHEEHERMKVERRKSHENNHNGHKRDLSGTFGFEATKKDREHEEEKVRKRKSMEGRHKGWGIDIPRFWKRHEKCEEKPECVVPQEDKEHEKEECPHA